MKKVLSLIIALLMALTGAAMAEAADSTVSYALLMDPVVSADGAPIVDMTGLAFEVDAAVSESGLASLIFQALVGENYTDNVIYAQAQIDENGIVMGVDGLSNLYSLAASSFDASQLTKVGALTAPAESIQKVIDKLAVSSEDGVYTLALTKEDSAELFQKSIAMMSVMGAMSGGSVDTSNLEGIAVELNGEAKVPGDGSMNLTLNGEISKEGETETTPVSLTCELTAEGQLNAQVDVAATDDDVALSVFYTADIENTDDGIQSTGYLSASVTEDGTTYALDTYLNTGSYTMATTDWAFDGSSAIDLTTMDETQMNSLQVGALGIMGTAVTKLQENVPGLADILNSFTSGMMG